MGLGFRGRRAGGRRRANRARQQRQRRRRQQNRRRHRHRGGFGGRRRAVNYSGGIRFVGFRSRFRRGLGFYRGGGGGGRVANQGSSTVSVTVNDDGQDVVGCDPMAQLICFTPFSVAMLIAGLVLFFIDYKFRLVSYVLLGIGGGFLFLCLIGCFNQCFDEAEDDQGGDVEAQSRSQSNLSVVSTASNFSHAPDTTSMARLSAAYNELAPQVGHQGAPSSVPAHGPYQPPMMMPQPSAIPPQGYPGQPTPSYPMSNNYPSNYDQAYGFPQHPQPVEMPQPPPPSYDDVMKV